MPKVTGEADKAIRAAFQQVDGIHFVDIFGAEWITQQILTSKCLRAFVPRIYGLGDLSQILDERVYRQANEILQSWKDNLAKFVPTNAHERSVRALFNEGFVLLLGDPMAGKSTIAAALALAAADRWDCLPVFVRHPDDIKAHWIPDEPHQLFWVDDAFGQIQLESDLTAGWNRVFPYLAAAIRKGARVLFTSRTYIYRAAIRELKESAFPLLKNSQVVIDVENLTLVEKERILYNHLRLGKQPPEFRATLKPYLPAIAANPKFFPEVAKRLGDPLFTKNLMISSDGLKRFVEEPKDFLAEIIGQLDRPNFAALALLFMRAGRVAIPPKVDLAEAEAMELLGASLALLCEAFGALNGSLVGQVLEAGERFWTFRHPTVRDAMALRVADRPELLDIYLGGVKTAELLSEVVCGAVEIEGAKVHVPESRFHVVISYLVRTDVTDWAMRYRLLGVLVKRCSDTFLSQWIRECEPQLRILFSKISISDYSLCRLLSRLQSLECLPEAMRLAYLKEVREAAGQSAEAMFVSDDLRNLLTTLEFEAIIEKVKEDVVPFVDWMVDQKENEYEDPEEDPSDYFDDLRSNFRAFEDYFYEDEDAAGAFQDGLQQIRDAVKRLTERNEERDEEERQKKEQEEEHARQEEFEHRMRATLHSNSVKESKGSENALVLPILIPRTPPRSIFDDVDT